MDAFSDGPAKRSSMIRNIEKIVSEDYPSELLCQIKSGNTGRAIRDLSSYLFSIKNTLPQEEWSVYCEMFRQHPLHQVLLRDPYTNRAYSKPRGYPGDAVMLDFVYDKKLPEGICDIGVDLFQETTSCPNALSVVERRSLFVDAITKIARQRDSKIRALSVACGHLREADLLNEILLSQKLDIICLDQDERSLAEIERRYKGNSSLGYVHKTIKQLFTSNTGLGTFDIIWSSGLYDYLDSRLSRLLTARLTAMLKPNGHLLLSNFAPWNTNCGYMEAVMDWQLILRDETEMTSILVDAAHGQLSEPDITRDRFRNIVFLEAVRG